MKVFDWNKPTVQMLGRWQPWHEGHTALFKRAIAKTGQVVIQMRDVHAPTKDDNPFDYVEVQKHIIQSLQHEGYIVGQDYEIMLVPNIVNITYGRDVGYVIEQEVFEESITSVSATAIREAMRKEGKL